MKFPKENKMHKSTITTTTTPRLLIKIHNCNGIKIIEIYEENYA
jgi:hypothetical protein